MEMLSDMGSTPIISTTTRLGIRNVFRAFVMFENNRVYTEKKRTESRKGRRCMPILQKPGKKRREKARCKKVGIAKSVWRGLGCGIGAIRGSAGNCK